MTHYVLLWLEAPLQSWGVGSKFGRRTTMDFPTRSGVLGLVLSAMGATGEQKDFLRDFSRTDGQTVISYVPKDGVQEKLCDYQVIGNGYDENDPWSKLNIPVTSKRKSASTKSKLTYRYYLQDAAFAVVMAVPFQHLESVDAALLHPVFDIFLGRKCCAPTDFVYRGIYTNKEDALDTGADIARDKGRTERFRVVDGCVENADDTFFLADVPVQFGEDKRYMDRQVSLIYAG